MIHSNVNQLAEVLITVAQVNRTPAGGFGYALISPRAVWQLDTNLLMERPIFMNGHARGLLRIRIFFLRRLGWFVLSVLRAHGGSSSPLSTCGGRAARSPRREPA